MIPSVMMAAAIGAVADPYLTSVTALLHFDGTNGATTFTDLKGSTWTRTNGASGAATISTAQNKFGGSSLSVGNNGSYDGIVTNNSDYFKFGSGDFTVEAWVYPTSFSQVGVIFAASATTGDLGFIFEVDTSGHIIVTSSTTTHATSSTTLSLNTWSHVAASRTGTTLTLWINGVQGASVTNSKNFSEQGPVSIGVIQSGSLGGSAFQGYIDELRVTKGVGRYTGAFSVPYAAFQDPAIGDPFFSYVSMLLHMDGTNGSTTFTDVKGNTCTPTGTVSISTAQSKAGGASGSFGGGRIGLGTNLAAINFGSGDFTVEAWVYPTATGILMAGQSDYATGAGSSFNFYIKSGTCDLYIGSTGYTYTAPNPTLNTWSHVAFVRSGTTVTAYLNGTSVGSVSIGSGSINTGATNNQACIGSFNSGSNAMNGYVDELRVTKGFARYTANFTPPSAPFPDS